MAPFTLAEIDAILVDLKASYQKLSKTPIQQYGIANRQAAYREMDKLRREIEAWERKRDRLLRGGIKARGVVVPH
jgi:hypothetical protein